MMGLGKKLSTLINATLRGGLPKGRKRRPTLSDDPEAQLKAIREALAEVEVKERQVAGRLKATQVKIDEAVEQGDREEAAAQRRMARELEAHLETQSTEALHLAEKLTAIEERLAEKRAEAEENLAAAQETIARSMSVGGETQEHIEPLSPATNDDEATTPEEDDDLSARKSRLSG